MNIAIIGAGVSGVNLYRHLQNDDNNIVIFEKSRGAGGRCSTRYINDKLIDHGTPFFKADNRSCINFCDEMISKEILSKNGEYYYPQQGINKLCSSLLNEDDLMKNTKIIKCQKLDNKWLLQDDNGVTYDGFDKLFVTIPAMQVLQLDIDLNSKIKEKLKNVQYDSIATLLVYSYTLQKLNCQKLLSDKSFKKIIDNSEKYHYENFSSYVIHLDEKTTNKQCFINKEEIQQYILKKVNSILGSNLEDDFHLAPHLWKFALVSKPLEEDFIYDENQSLGFCGDYFGGSTIQSAYLSAQNLYDQKLR